MAFPISYSKTLLFLPTSAVYEKKEEIFGEIKKTIQSESIRIDIQEDTLTFKGAIFRFAWNGFHLLNSISGGRVELSVHDDGFHLSFKLFFYEMFFISLAFMLIPLALARTPLAAIYATLVIWIGFYLVTIALAIMRFDKMIDKIVDQYQKHSEEKPLLKTEK